MTTTPLFTEICICARCQGALVAISSEALRCTACGEEYSIEGGVLVLLPEPADDVRERYVTAYGEIARADLNEPFEYDRTSRHDILIRFIGDVRGRRVLDIGSSDGGYLKRLDTRDKVALDIALPFLRAIPAETGIVRVCGDAENLPFATESFDVIILSDVLEHVLDPERLVQRLRAICRPNGRIIVHVPWREDIRKYDESPYEFTHLRSFGDYDFGLLWRDFRIVRERATHPALEEPILFHLRKYLPLSAYNVLTDRYFNHGLDQREYKWRERWITELPRRERLLLLVYPCKFRMFEFRPRVPRPARTPRVHASPRASAKRLLGKVRKRRIGDSPPRRNVFPKSGPSEIRGG